MRFTLHFKVQNSSDCRCRWWFEFIHWAWVYGSGFGYSDRGALGWLADTTSNDLVHLISFWSQSCSILSRAEQTSKQASERRRRLCIITADLSRAPEKMSVNDCVEEKSRAREQQTTKINARLKTVNWDNWTFHWPQSRWWGSEKTKFNSFRPIVHCLSFNFFSSFAEFFIVKKVDLAVVKSLSGHCLIYTECNRTIWYSEDDAKSPYWLLMNLN